MYLKISVWIFLYVLAVACTQFLHAILHGPVVGLQRPIHKIFNTLQPLFCHKATFIISMKPCKAIPCGIGEVM